MAFQMKPFSALLAPGSWLYYPLRLASMQRANWRRLWTAPTPTTRFLILSGALWTLPLAFTEPYKGLYYSKLGLSNAGIGAVMGLDSGLRVLGMLLGTWAVERFGPKRTLIAFDLLSWVLPSAILAFATQPWHLTLAAVCFASNALSSVAYQLLFTHRIPQARLARSFALANLLNVMPNILLPGLAAYLVATQPFLPALRAMYGIQACMMLNGILLRVPLLKDIPIQPTVAPGGSLGDELRERLAQARGLLQIPRMKSVVGLFVLTNTVNAVFNSYIGIYLVRHLGLAEALPGLWAQIGALFYVGGSYLLIPRLRDAQVKAALFMAYGLLAASVVLLALSPGAGGMLLVSAMMGVSNAVIGAVLSAMLASRLPEQGRAWGFTLAFVTQQLAMGLAYPLAGAALSQWFLVLPLGLGLVSVAQLGLSFRLWNLDKPGERGG